MSNKTFTISKAFVLSALKKDGARVYYDVDSHSGGYPYWSTSALGCRQFHDLDKIPTFKHDDYMRREVTVIEVLEVKYQARVVESTEVVSEVKAKAMAEIAKIEKELARKVSMLETMK